MLNLAAVNSVGSSEREPRVVGHPLDPKTLVASMLGRLVETGYGREVEEVEQQAVILSGSSVVRQPSVESMDIVISSGCNGVDIGFSTCHVLALH